MKKFLFSTILIINGLFAFAQAPHIYEHTYRMMMEEIPQDLGILPDFGEKTLKICVISNFFNKTANY